jgi:molecular chaperone GrpE
METPRSNGGAGAAAPGFAGRPPDGGSGEPTGPLVGETVERPTDAVPGTGAHGGIAEPGGAGSTSPQAGGMAVEELAREVERLRAALEEARSQAQEYLAALQRERAEFINFKRRAAEEREAALGLASEALILKVLGLADDFDRAIAARPADLVDHPWVEGIVAIDRKLRALLESEGVRPIDAASGTQFDPREHEAVLNVPSPDRKEGEIVEQFQRGYRLRDRVLRPALVAVASGGAETPGGAGKAGATAQQPEAGATAEQPGAGDSQANSDRSE